MSLSARVASLLVLAAIVVTLGDSAAVAQFAHHPFAIGGNEGAVGHQNAFGAWILAQESRFYLQLTGAVRSSKTSPAAALVLMALAFAYGIFHAAGPGHGKAVITTYMVSNEVALRRGLVLACFAALVQALVATALVGLAAFAFNASAQSMTASAQVVEFTGYLGIIAFGLMLVWRKGRALKAAFRLVPAEAPRVMAFAGFSPTMGHRGAISAAPSRFTIDDGSHPEDCDCGYSHMPDPALLSGKRLDIKSAVFAVVLAGARPCSGALLVLVFAASQGVFLVGVLATFAMAAGTALTTGALATAAVLAKDIAVRLTGSRRSVLAMRLVECVAAAAILVFGVALLAAALEHGA